MSTPESRRPGPGHGSRAGQGVRPPVLCDPEPMASRTGSLRISLLGRPAIERDGTAYRLRSQKSWALLACLLLAGLSAAGCGGSSGEESTSRSAPAAQAECKVGASALPRW